MTEPESLSASETNTHPNDLFVDVLTCVKCFRKPIRFEMRDGHAPAPGLGSWWVCECGHEWTKASKSLEWSRG